MILRRTCWLRARDALRRSPILIAAAWVAAISAGLLPAAANEIDFATWLGSFKAEARSHGISERTLQSALGHVTPIARVIELDHKQPEFTLTFDEYIARVVPQARVDKGRELLAKNRGLLERIASRYGVQPRFVVALWGIESDYGRVTGDFPVVDALATLAYDGRRSGYFRGELLDALTILERGYIDLTSLRGSWAGAMGQNQFMPSSYLHYAVDFDGKGQRDIWHNPADVFASTANYLSQLGWRADESWGRPVKLPKEFNESFADLSVQKQLVEWNAIGVRTSDGTLLPDRPPTASIVIPEGVDGPAFLAYGNFRALMKWNRSVFFAVGVGLLADRVGGQ
jgi:membrane-bound lytic murein transglycosylase B